MIYIYVSALSLPKLYAFGQIPKLLEDSFFVFVKWGLEVTKRPFHSLTFNGSMEFFFLCDSPFQIISLFLQITFIYELWLSLKFGEERIKTECGWSYKDYSVLCG